MTYGSRQAPVHLNKQAFIDWFKSGRTQAQFRQNCTIWVAHENGAGDAEGPYQHTHVVIWCDLPNVTFNSSNARIFDYKEDGSDVSLHPHIATDRLSSLLRLQRYIAKEDEQVKQLLAAREAAGGVAGAQSLAERVWSYPTLTEMLRNEVEKPSEVMGLQALYQAGYHVRLQRRLESEAMNTPLKPWQDFFYQLLISDSREFRAIHWVYDPVGNTGKSALCRRLLIDFPQDVLSLSQMGGQRDAPTIVKNALENGWSSKILVVDLPRTAETHSIYSPLESIKNGSMTAVKYQGTSVVFPAPKIVVFANFLPNKQKMSLDRWKIYKLSTALVGHSITLVRVPTSAVYLDSGADGEEHWSIRGDALLQPIALGTHPVIDLEDGDGPEDLIFDSLPPLERSTASISDLIRAADLADESPLPADQFGGGFNFPN